MSDNKKYYYLKLKESYFDQDHIKVIEAMDNGYIYSLILLKLHLKAIKGNGCLMIAEGIPYDPTDTSMIAKVIGHDPDHVNKALNVARSLNMIEVVDSREIWFSDMQTFIGQSSTEGERKKIYREKLKNQKSLPLQQGGQTSDIRPLEIELDIEKEIELEIGNTLEANASESLPPKSKPKLSELKLKPDNELTRDELILVKTDKLFTWAYDRAKINGKLPVGKSALEKWIFAGKKTARNWVEEYIDDLGKIAKIIEYCETDPYWDVNFKNLTQFNTIRTQLQEKYFKEMK